MKKWHKTMKKTNPEKYYKWQYERFKKVGRGYGFTLKDKTPVRNLLEKQIGDFLIMKRIEFEYEPLIRHGKKAYFPDFKVTDSCTSNSTAVRHLLSPWQEGIVSVDESAARRAGRVTECSENRKLLHRGRWRSRVSYSPCR